MEGFELFKHIYISTLPVPEKYIQIYIIYYDIFAGFNQNAWKMINYWSYKIYKMIKMTKPTTSRFICAQKKGYEIMFL